MLDGLKHGASDRMLDHTIGTAFLTVSMLSRV